MTGPTRLTDAAPDKPETEATLRCFSCRYNLHGVVSETCPECGFSVERSRAYGAYSDRPFLFAGRMNAWNLALTFGPALCAVSGVVFWGLSRIAEPVSVLVLIAGLCAALFLFVCPLGALMTMPWRRTYLDADSFGLGWRLTALALQWVVLVVVLWVGGVIYGWFG